MYALLVICVDVSGASIMDVDVNNKKREYSTGTGWSNWKAVSGICEEMSGGRPHCVHP